MPVGTRPRVGRAAERHAGALEQVRDRSAGTLTEQRQRRRLGGDQLQPGVVDAHRTHLVGGHERQLVERQRPGGPRRHDEGDGVRPVLLEVGEQPVVGQRRGVSGERDRAGERGAVPRADGEDELVVVERAGLGQAHGMALGVHRHHGVGDELGTDAIREVSEGVPGHMVRRERFGRAQRMQLDIALGRDERHAHAGSGQIVQGERELDAGDSSADDDDMAAMGQRGHGQAPLHSVGTVERSSLVVRDHARCGARSCHPLTAATLLRWTTHRSRPPPFSRLPGVPGRARSGPARAVS